MGFPNIWNLIPRPNLTHLATYICVYMCVCIYRCVCVRTHVRGRIYIYIYTHAHMYGCAHIRVYTCMCKYLTHSVTYTWCLNIHEIHVTANNSIMPWRCPWCNCYRRRKWTRRHEFKSWTRLIAFHIALIPLGKVWIQLFSLQLWVNSRTD